MYKVKKNRNFRNYSFDYRNLYGKDVFSISKKDKSFDDITVKEDVEYIKTPKIDFDEDEKTKKKKSSFQHFLKYMLKKVIKILATSVIITALVFLIAAVFGTVMELEKKEQLISYDNLIWPVVAQDPEPFDQEHPLNRETMLKTGVLDACLRCKSGSDAFDDSGRLVISGQDVKDSVYKLFKTNIDIKESIPDGTFFFKYDVSEDNFYVESINNDLYFTPHTKYCENIGDNMIKLTVEYLIPKSQFDGVFDVGKEARVGKVMQYFLKKDDQNKNFYLIKVYCV